MKQLWISTQECTGCGACADVCPKNAIRMDEDNCGFIYPRITNDCVECNLCERTCLQRGKREASNFLIPKTYAAWTQNSEIRFCSTSGGIFSELASTVLQKDGEVAGAQYRKDNLVEHTIINSLKDLYRIRQSKYIQSEPNGIYKAVKQSLGDDKTVLFCGAPCQVAVLYAYLGKEYDRLITVDFICRGMNSPKAYSSWLGEIEKSEQSKAVRVWFKYKEGGWKSSPKRTKIDFEDGHSVIKYGKDNLFMHGYLTSNLYIRPSCGNCVFKGVPRQSDITLADFWGIEKNLDDDKGTSVVLINSETGARIFDEVKNNLVFHERCFEEVFKGNVCFTESVKIPEKSREFLCELDKIPFSVAIKRYSSTSFSLRLRNRIKRIILGNNKDK